MVLRLRHIAECLRTCVVAVGLVSCTAGQTGAAAPTETTSSQIALSRPAALAAEATATFVGYDGETGASYILQPELAEQRFAPYSTFKIPNFLIAIDSGAIDDPEQVHVWDAQRRPREDHWPKDWARDHSLSSAFRASAVWFFRDVAKQVGRDRYAKYLRQFGYGNASLPPESDDFWLGGSLAISPREQVAFLKKLHAGRFQISPDAVDALQQVTEIRSHSGYELHGNTGAGPIDPKNMDGPFGGWLVGWVERPARKPFYYAFYMEGAGFRSVWQSRTSATISLLKAARALPREWPEG